MASTAELAIRISAHDTARDVLQGLTSPLQGIASAAAPPTSALGGLTNALGKIGLAGMGLQTVVGAAKGLGEALGLGLANEMEQVRASFQAFTKDGALTEQVLQQVRTEAAKTPFAFQEMAKATAALMPVAKGAKVDLMELVKEAEILAASNPLQGLEGASFSLREAMVGDFTSIIERFNLSRSTINQLKAEGVPNLEIVRRAMKEMGFDSDLIAAKAETLSGRWSTFMDTLDGVKLRVAEPIFNALKEGLTGLQGVLDENETAVTALAENIAVGLTQAIQTARVVVLALVDAIATVTSFLKEHREVQLLLVGILGAAATAMALHTAAVVAHTIVTQGISLATGAWTAAQWLLNAALTANPIGLVVVAIGGLVAALVYAYQTSETFRNIVDGAFSAVKDVVTGAIGAASAALNGFLGAINGVVSAIGGLLDAIGRIPSSISLPSLPSFSLPGFQHGGAFTVGGSGGVDSRVVAFRASPGERVTVSPPGGGGGGLDYGRLAAALAHQPVVIQMDGREVGRLVRTGLLRDSQASIGVGLS